MGMLDQSTKRVTAQAVTTTVSSNVYDSGSANLSDISMTGENLWINAVVDTTATSDGSAGLQVFLQDSADNITFNNVASGPWFTVAQLTAGTTLMQMQPLPGMRRYFRVVWRVSTAALTAGKFTAYVSNSLQRNVARPSGFTVA